MLVEKLVYSESLPPRYVGVGLTPDPTIYRWEVHFIKNGQRRVLGDYSVSYGGKYHGRAWVGNEVYENTTATSKEEVLAWMSTIYSLIKGDKP